MENTDMSLKEAILKLVETNQQLMEEKKVKGFKLPFGARLNKGKIKQNFVTICYVKDNRDVSFLKAPIVEGTLTIDGVPRLATTDYMLNYKGKPFIVLPSWSTEPFSPVANYEETVKDQMTVQGWRLLINKIENEQLKPKMKFGAGWILGGIILLVVVIYFITKGGKIF